MVVWHESDEQTFEGPRRKLVLQSLESNHWKGWTINRKGNYHAAEKALMEYQAYQQGVKDNYHLNGKNCQDFTDYCLTQGIGSEFLDPTGASTRSAIS